MVAGFGGKGEEVQDSIVGALEVLGGETAFGVNEEFGKVVCHGKDDWEEQ